MKQNLKLTGGIFFNFLLKGLKPKYTKIDNNISKRGGITEFQLMQELIETVNQNHPKTNSSTMRTNTSQYKACKINDSDWLPFNNDSFINNFKNLMLNNYKEIEKRFVTFITKFFDLEDTSNLREIGQNILELIKKDETISNDTIFIFSEKTRLKKDEIKPNLKYHLHSILLATWFYIIENKVNNKDGKLTLENFISNKGHSHSLKIFEPNFDKRIFKETIITIISDKNVKFDEAKPKILNLDILDSTEQKIQKYLKNINLKYNKLKTLLYSEEPHKFYDFYVCNDLTFDFRNNKISFNTLIKRTILKNAISNATIEKITKKYSNFIIVSGTGGLGKSMMMRHLLLSASKAYKKTREVPIFVALKDYTSEYVDFLDFINDKIKNISKLSNDDIETLLINGKAILLLDGLDEINTNILEKFYSAIEAFIDRYSDNTFIISTRPYTNTICLNRFTTLKLLPFNKDQSINLINKLEFRPDEPEIKNKFIAQLTNTLYDTHKEFASNPLLLTIMLMTFEQYAEVPQKMHIFYREAYTTMAQKHDASKGAYKRNLKTGLSTDRFADYLSEFCARTYIDEKYEFSAEEFNNYFIKLEEHKRNENENISGEDFLNDLKENMCLVYYESNKYHFTHRSFQEYFSALYFSKQKDKNLPKIGNLFEKKNINLRNDQTLNMLYDMIPDKVEEYIFLPYLKNILNKLDSSKSYWSFLEILYPIIYCYHPFKKLEEKNSIYELDFAISDLEKKVIKPNNMLLYNFMKNINKIYGYNDYMILPNNDDFIIEYLISINNDVSQILGIAVKDKDKFNIDSDDNEIFKITKLASILEIKISVLKTNKSKYKEIINAINDINFPLYKEYVSLINYYKKLENDSKVSSEDFFENLL